MPLDGHSYLVSQGWSGHGTGLREDSIVRPLAIPQKRTLTGLGKDRDEAFPFWDHLFSVAANAIQIKLSIDDDDSSVADSPEKTTTSNLERTATGILSNKPPKCGTPASGSATPTILSTPVPTILSSRNLLIVAKQEAAKRSLYSRFFRGPILGPDQSDTGVGPSFASLNANSRLDGSPSSAHNSLDEASSRTPMAIAKAKMVTANDAVVPVVPDLKTTKKKRKRETPAEEGVQAEEAEVKAKKQESKEERRRRKEEKKEKKKERLKKKVRIEKKGEEGKEEKGNEEHFLVKESGVKKSKKLKRQIDPTPDPDYRTAEVRPAIDSKMGKQRESRDRKTKRLKIKIRETKGSEDGCEHRKADLAISDAELAAAYPDSTSQNVDMAVIPPDSTPTPSETDVLRKKKWKTVK